MKKLFDPLFVFYCAAWCLIHFFRYIHHPIPLLNGYLTDLTAVPAMAHLTVTITRRFIVQDDTYVYPLSYILFIAAYVSFVFEWLMPRCSNRYTGDWWDVTAYFAGSIFYYCFHRKAMRYSI